MSVSESQPEAIPDTLEFAPDGTAAGLYTEAIDLRALGRLEVERATAIEFSERCQQWEVRDFTGATLHQSPSRQECLRWERRYFNGDAEPDAGAPIEPRTNA